MNSAASPSSTSLAVRLRAFLVAHFSRNELELLCLDLHVDPEDVPGMGAGKDYWAAQIVRYFERRDALPELIRRCRELRPDAPWDELDAALPADEAAARSLPRLAILYAEPLAYRRDGAAEAEPIDRLDFAAERECLCDVFKEAGRAVVVEFAPCNAGDFRRVVTLGCRALHYSGHGHPDFLAFEDDEAGLNPITVSRLFELLSAGGEPAIRFAFVSACHSRRAGQAFVEAGVPHVVAVRVETAVLDVAAREFARHFYLALLAGKTVRQAFEIGQAYVAALPDVRADADKFVLLPAGADHERTVFDDAPAGSWRDATPPLPPGNLPAPPERLIGRNATLQQVIAEVLRSRLVTLRGAPGIGKSSLAVAAAHYLRERRRFRDGVLFISLRNAVSTEQLRADMASALGLAEIKEDRQLFAALRERRCLFVLDNAEDALNAAFAPQFRRFVRDLLTGCAGVRLLVTSRQALGGGLPGVAERVIKPPPLDPISAARLLLALAPDPDRLIAELGAGGITTLDALARHPMLGVLAGNPFAISLAAPLLGDKTLAEVSALIEARPVEALAVQGVPEDERDETMSVARSLGASFDALHRRNPPAARLFGVMGLLPGGALAANLDAIWGEGWPALMDELVGRSLIEREPGAFGPRHIAFPFVAAFAESRLSADDRRDFALRVADHMAQLSGAIYEQVGREGARAAYALFQLHEDNLRACLRTTRPAREKRADETASPVGIIASYLPQILLRAYRLDDAISVTSDGLAACRAVGDRLGEANVLKAIGDVQRFRTETNAALESYAKALDLFKAVGDRLGEANVYLAIGGLQGEPGLFEQAIAIYRAIGDAYSTARGLYFYGLWLLHADQLERAVECLSEARQIWAGMGFAQGVQLAEQALARAWSQMIPPSVQGPLAAFAAALQAAQADERDVALWQAAVEAGEALLAALEAAPPVPGLSVADVRAELASAWNTLGNARDEAGDKPGALAAFERAIALQPDFAMWHRNRAGTLIELGRLDEAAAAIETARRLEPDAPRLRELDEQLAAARAAAAGKAC
ncbi:MAG: tetratricopeptide repeat protein [Anaerolineae bacterium]|nr:tetratricopeptide repeat protein [Anaerolineae bacterium]